MITVETKIVIDAPIDICFDFARDIDVHNEALKQIAESKKKEN